MKVAGGVEHKIKHAALASILCFLGGVFCLLLQKTGLIGSSVSDILLILIVVLFFVTGAWFLWSALSKQHTKKKTRFYEEDIKTHVNNEESKSKMEKLRWQLHRIQAEQQEREVRLENLQEQIEETEKPCDTIQTLQFEQKALELAQNHMQQAAREMTHSFGDILNGRASEILAEITNGRYTRLMIDEQLNMEILEQGKRIAVKKLSAGTLEQIYFALRMASAELLYAEPLPLIFDEAFAYYDEKRLKSTLKWLSQQERQVIIFTCQRREQQIAAQM